MSHIRPVNPKFSCAPGKPLIFLAWLLLLITPIKTYPIADAPMLAELKSDYGKRAYDRGLKLQALLNQLKQANTNARLSRVNDFFNEYKYKTDLALWGVEDYWATPVEFTGKHGGDCEDYVISKYFALRSLGIPDEKLFLTYAKATKQNVAHMVLNYFEAPTSVPLVLDNYNPELLPASKRSDLIPLYSFNADSLFLSNPAAGLGKALPTDKIRNSKWDKLLAGVRNKRQ